MVVWCLYDVYTMSICWLYDVYMMVIWWLYDVYMMAIWCLYDGYMMSMRLSIWCLYDGNMMSIWWLHDVYMMAIWCLCGVYMMSIWWLYDVYIIVIWCLFDDLNKHTPKRRSALRIVVWDLNKDIEGTRRISIVSKAHRLKAYRLILTVGLWASWGPYEVWCLQIVML